jgi:hypothetical protein
MATSVSYRRGWLSVVGLSLGVAAFLCSVAVGQETAQQLAAQIQNLGENLIWIEAVGRQVNGVRTGTHGTMSLTLGDLRAIWEQIPLVVQLSPHVNLGAGAVGGYFGGRLVQANRDVTFLVYLP